ncbi:MAG: endo alpha-1,4 polygalactosaminidase [Gammaproteobacteria bacterium]|nr:endo alpha-1,4 polygalactosaminidase [Gammaproteobacteria bacterium]
MKRTSLAQYFFSTFFVILFSISLTACGGGSGGDSDNPSGGNNSGDGPGDSNDNPADPPSGAMKLDEVEYWAYQIQRFSHDGSVDAIVASRYDMFVGDVTHSDRDEGDFDMADAMRRVLDSAASKNGRTKLPIAYVDVGEAEDWRIYWDEATWVAPTDSSPGEPDFMVRPDPDGWEGNYPVAYWDQRWKDIIIYNDDSMLNLAIDVGFKGIYMDWVEAYSDDGVEARAVTDGVDTATEMVKFICEIRDAARARDPDFLVIQQNAPDLIDDVPDAAAYLDCLDAMAQEQIYYDGDATDNWNDPAGCDDKVPETGHGYSAQWYETQLAKYQQAGLRVFNVDYACDAGNAETAYSRATNNSYVPYVSRRSLSELTDNPPPGMP